MAHTYTIALTGALGLLGSGITTAALTQGHRVVALDIRASDADAELLRGVGSVGEITPEDIALRRAAIEAARSGQYVYKQVDLTDYASAKRAIEGEGCDALIHLAAVYAQKDGEGNYISGPLQHLGIERVVTASSVNSIGMVFSKRPQFDYLPLTESHPFYPEDAYSLSKHITEVQSDSIARAHPRLRIASMRFHWVVPTPLCSRAALHARGATWKDLWGWVSIVAAADACLRGITVESLAQRGARGSDVDTGTGTGTGWTGHETFFIVARTTVYQSSSADLVGARYPEITDMRFVDASGKPRGMEGNEALICTDKAERLLGWKEEGYPWSAE